MNLLSQPNFWGVFVYEVPSAQIEITHAEIGATHAVGGNNATQCVGKLVVDVVKNLRHNHCFFSQRGPDAAGLETEWLCRHVGQGKT